MIWFILGLLFVLLLITDDDEDSFTKSLLSIVIIGFSVLIPILVGLAFPMVEIENKKEISYDIENFEINSNRKPKIVYCNCDHAYVEKRIFRQPSTWGYVAYLYISIEDPQYTLFIPEKVIKRE